MTLDAFSLTKAGEREVNEDSVVVAPGPSLSCYAVADGLGAHGGGDVASQTAIGTVEALAAQEWEDSVAFLSRCFVEAQQAVLRKRIEHRHTMGMKTTLAALVVTPEFEAIWAHLGDTRLYHFPAKQPWKWTRTQDHSVPQALLSAGAIREKDIRFHQDRSKLLHALGMEGEDLYTTVCEAPVQLRPGDAFLLCSDGFWEWIAETQMLWLLAKTKTAEDWVLAMERHILSKGNGKGMDNYSAVALKVR
jgi:serine/threonine protein phosphatase PrpC